ncbi:GST-like protein [Faunimonas pinastri]|uniref:GST-like protein n=1 Tax=Faunimonas pinastri TaxID=1855383 RepID=A0A1H9MAI3_9HYPH|nr:glutathione S-transferase N-terminal domain-containing protein [Faunimonas pinastri]SER20760.1 GST-like protein [Faunimonas pinastri]
MSATQTKPIELYFWPTPNGFKISMFLEEAGVPYDVKFVNIGKGDQFKPEFLEISPNNKMPAIVDPEGPGGQPISVFESGAILLYLGRKFGKFYPTEERKRVEVEEWVMWQMGGFGPMLGQNHHFAIYAPEKLPYAIKRYRDETHRLYGVLNKRLEGREFICGDYSIADMASLGWARGWERQGMDLVEFPNVKRWMDGLMARPAVQKAFELKAPETMNLAEDKDAQKMLFNQRAR